MAARGYAVLLPTQPSRPGTGWRSSAEMAERNSPYRFADAITTPVLVIHGD